MRYHFPWSPKPARLPLYSILPWLRVSAQCIGRKEDESCLRHMRMNWLWSTQQGWHFFVLFMNTDFLYKLMPTVQCQDRLTWVLVAASRV